MAGKFELETAKSGKFHFNLKASNGRIILSSEMYESRKAAEVGIASVKKNAADEKRYDRKKSTKGEHYFNLKSANGEPIGRSEMYTTAAGMESGIASVTKNAPDAAVVDG
ncbi:MAG: YegP family protein [Pyrinomonadaceae bacterium]